MNSMNARNRSRTNRPAVGGNRVDRTHGSAVGRNRLHTQGGRPGSAMRTLRRQAQTITHDARGLAVSAGAVAREQLDPMKDYVVDKPLQSLLIAAGVGLIFGLIFFRR